MKKTARSIIIIILAILISFFGAIKAIYADWRYAESNNNTDQPKFKDDKYLFELADRFGLMALFAHVSYRDDLLVKEKRYDKAGDLEEEIIVEDKRDSACDYLFASTPPSSYGMPYLLATDEGYTGGRWSRWQGSKNIESEPCYNQEGLFYETYVYTTGDKIQEAVIAFRGTENHKSEIWLDWKTNIVSIFGFEPEQYKIASKSIPKVIAALNDKNPDINIYATGHSLGGGLAQQAGYLSKDIKEVFTFNTSPVTNWTSLSLRDGVQNAYPIIHRIYNGGEVLSGIRSLTTLFTKARYGRHDIGIQVKPKKLVAGHSMTLLSCHLSCLIESNATKTKAIHSFSAEFIRKKIMVEHGVCSGYVNFGECDLTASDE